MDSLGRVLENVRQRNVDKDLLAVAYGQFDFLGQRDGMILFWSLKNPEGGADTGHCP